MKKSTDPILVGYTRNYNYPDLLRQSQDGKGKWNHLQFIDLETNKQTKVDVLLVLNQPHEKLKIKVRKGGKLVVIQEPPYSKNDFLNLVMRHFDLSISDFNNSAAKKNISIPGGLPWHIDKSYSELNTDIEISNQHQKKNQVSWITSSASAFEGHKIRLKFIEFLKQKEFDFDLFGRGFNPIDSKLDGISPYKYSIAAENYIAPNYFTEKIIDVYLANAIPMYYGCSNIGDFFPKKSYIQLDLCRQQWSLDKMKEAIQGDYYTAHFKEIEEAKNRILHEFQLFPMVEKIINNHLTLEESFEKVKLRKNGLTEFEFLKEKLRKLK
jgi:hypothetical protein